MTTINEATVEDAARLPKLVTGKSSVDVTDRLVQEAI